MIESPVIIVGCARSGTTLLFNILSEAPTLWSIGHESKAIIERYHHPHVKDWESGELSQEDLTPASRRFILKSFENQAAPGSFWSRVNKARRALRKVPIWQAIKRHGHGTGPGSRASSGLPQRGLSIVRAAVRVRNAMRIGRSPRIRLLEKTPENCLRLPFLKALFPDLRLIFLTRDGRNNVNSLIEGWRHPHLFAGYDVPVELRIPGYGRRRWAFTLIPGWRELASRPLAEICAKQWVNCNETVLKFIESTEHGAPSLHVRYEDLISSPVRTIGQVAKFIAIDEQFSRTLEGKLPRVNVVSEPAVDKWRGEHREEIEKVLPLMAPTMERLGYASSSL